MSYGGLTLPKGFRFQPSDEELLSHYLEKKNQRKDPQITAIIPEIDVCKHEPRDLPALVFTRAGFLDREWFTMADSPDMGCYFFSPRVYKHSNSKSKSKSTKIQRTTKEGSWKKQGDDRRITGACSDKQIGGKRILTFYLPKKQKTDWVIHEYYLTDTDSDEQTGDFVLCHLKDNRLKNKSGTSDRDQQNAAFCGGGEPSSSSCRMVSNFEDQASKGLRNVLPLTNDNDVEAEHDGSSCSTALHVENTASKQLENVLPVPNGHDDDAEHGGGIRHIASGFENGEAEYGMLTETEEYQAFEALRDSFCVSDESCLKYKSDNSGHDKDAPSCNRGSSSYSMSSNVLSQDEENWVSQVLVIVVPISNGNDYEAENGGSCSGIENQAEENRNDDQILNNKNDEAETGGGVITEEEAYQTYWELEDAVQFPIGNPHEDPCCTDQTNRSNFVQGQPDRSSSSDMVEELLNDPKNLGEFFNPPAPPQLHQLQPLQESPIDTNVPERRKRTYPFEYNDPSLLKKNNISTNDDDIRVSNCASSENQAANVIPEGYSQLESDEYGYAQPSINGGPRDFSDRNNFIVSDSLQLSSKDIETFLAEFSDTDIDGGRGVTNDGNTKGVHQSISEAAGVLYCCLSAPEILKPILEAGLSSKLAAIQRILSFYWMHLLSIRKAYLSDKSHSSSLKGHYGKATVVLSQGGYIGPAVTWTLES